MGLKAYFSGDEDQRARFIFDLIAPLYGWIDRGLTDHYRSTVALLNDRFPLAGRRILDVGTGTGGWIAALSRYPLLQAAGIDLSPKMIRQARKKHPEIQFLEGDGKDLDDLPENSFDMVTCSFVMHGMKASARRKMLTTMFRLASRIVVVHDFHDPLPFLTRLLETLERSDYRNFIRDFTSEMKDHTSHLEVVPAGRGNALYLGWKEGSAAQVGDL